MAAKPYDLVVIGGGPAGQKAAIATAKIHRKVAIVERGGMPGGASLHSGTIPSKTLREAVLYFSGFRQRQFYGKDHKLKEHVLLEDLEFRVAAVTQRVPYEVGIARYEELAKGQILGAETGLLKVLFAPVDGRILGLHILGESAAELVHLGQTAMALRGTLAAFRDLVFNYPTLAEAYKVAALNGLNKVVAAA